MVLGQLVNLYQRPTTNPSQDFFRGFIIAHWPLWSVGLSLSYSSFAGSEKRSARMTCQWRVMDSDSIYRGPRPADRLPPELLTHIFQDVQLSLGWSWDDAGSAPDYPERVTWIRLTWVCSYWRLVALESPQLWTFIFVDHHPCSSLVPTLLERSRKMPLAVSIKHERKEVEAILGACLSHARRIHRLHFEGLAGLLLAPPVEVFDILEEVYIKQNFKDFFEADSIGSVHFFRGDFPRLRILSLGSVDIEWDTFSVPSLHELELDLRQYKLNSLSATCALRIMKDYPQLRLLKLSRYSTCVPARFGMEESNDEMDVVSLAHLEEIELTGTPGDVTYILDHLTVPSGGCAIRVKYDADWQDDVSPIEIVIPRQLAFQSLLPHCATVVLDVDDSRSTISAFNELGTCFLAVSSPDDMRRYFTIMEGIWMSILDAFSCSPLSRFSLRYHYPPSITADMWTILFSRFPIDTVETSFDRFTVQSGSANHVDKLFEAMCGPASFGIRTLEFASLLLTYQATEAILDLLEYRDRIGRPLEKLVFVLCFCEGSLDMRWSKRNLESYTEVEIRYDWNADTTADEFKRASNVELSPALRLMYSSTLRIYDKLSRSS